MSHVMHPAKRIEFEYNSANNDRDVIIDQLGEMPCNEVGDIVVRRDKSWKVTQVLTRQSDSGFNTLLTLCVSLSDKL
jgi:hypothetical protein